MHTNLNGLLSALNVLPVVVLVLGVRGIAP
jgi:hypothetical protein